jgi:hypothetical protein
MKIPAVRLSSLFDLLYCHFQSETLQLANQPFARLVHVTALEVLTSSILIPWPVLQDVGDHYQNAVAHRRLHLRITGKPY